MLNVQSYSQNMTYTTNIKTIMEKHLFPNHPKIKSFNDLINRSFYPSYSNILNTKSKEINKNYLFVNALDDPLSYNFIEEIKSNNSNLNIQITPNGSHIGWKHGFMSQTSLDFFQHKDKMS